MHVKQTTYRQALAERLQWAWRWSGISQREIQRRMGGNQNSTGKLSKWISGREEMPAEHAAEFGAATGVAAGWLLTGEGEPVAENVLARAASASDAEMIETARRLGGEGAGPVRIISEPEDELRLLLRQVDRQLMGYSSEKRAAVRLLLEGLALHHGLDEDTTPLPDTGPAPGREPSPQSLPAPAGTAESSSRRSASRGTSRRRPT